MDCKYFRTQSTHWDFFHLGSVEDARPPGFKVNLQFSVIASQTAGIILSLADVRASPPYYEIRMIHAY